MIVLQEVVTFHKGLALPIEFGWFPGPREPEYGRGDNVGVITPTVGPGEDLEGAGDWSGLQIKLIGKEHQLAELRTAAHIVDSTLRFDLPVPGSLWGTWVRIVNRSAGPPELIQEDEHDRIATVCTYLVHELI